MQKHDFFGYQTEIDKTATDNWYVNSAEWGCECGHCRNFLALARQKALPLPIIEKLNELGIPPEKATYVCELFTDDTGIHYQFSYRLAGTILAAPQSSPANEPISGRCCHEPYPYGAPDFPEPHFDLEYYATLPWVLDEPNA